MYYKPTCPHCKETMPEFEKLAEEFKYVEDLVIARFDGTENEAMQSWPAS